MRRLLRELKRTRHHALSVAVGVSVLVFVLAGYSHIDHEAFPNTAYAGLFAIPVLVLATVTDLILWVGDVLLSLRRP